MNKYLDIKTGRVVTANEVKSSKPECITTKVDHLSRCLFGAGYGELHY